MTTNRRLFLASAALAAAPAAVLALTVAPAISGATVAELIAEHRRIDDLFRDACEREDALSSDKESAAYRQANDDWNDCSRQEHQALLQLLRQPARDRAELREKFAYIKSSLDFPFWGESELTALIESIA